MEFVFELMQAGKKSKKGKGGNNQAGNQAQPPRGGEGQQKAAGETQLARPESAPAGNMNPEAMQQILGGLMAGLGGGGQGAAGLLGGLGALAGGAGAGEGAGAELGNDLNKTLMKAFEGEFMSKFNELFASFQETPVNIEHFDQHISEVEEQLTEIEKLLDNIQNERYDKIPDPPVPPQVDVSGENAPPEPTKEESKGAKAALTQAQKKKAAEKEAYEPPIICIRSSCSTLKELRQKVANYEKVKSEIKTTELENDKIRELAPIALRNIDDDVKRTHEFIDLVNKNF